MLVEVDEYVAWRWAKVNEVKSQEGRDELGKVEKVRTDRKLMR